MAATAHTSTIPGLEMPDFELTDVVSQTATSRKSLAGAKGVLVVFLCRHCPYVVHVRDELLRIANEYVTRGIRTIAISSNDPDTYPDDAPEKLREMAVEHRFSFPVLFDETQGVARAFDAVCTPDFYLYDENLKLFYRGRLDDSSPKNGRPVTGADLRQALTALLAGNSAPPNPLPSIGCSIKWK